MEPKKPWLTMASTMVIAALLVACAGPAAAPTATPVPLTPTPELPTPTPISPTATPGPLDVALAYESAWNTFDANAVGALFAEPFNANYGGSTMTDLATWSSDWPYGMARGEHMRIKLRDCQVSGDSVTCTVGSITDCFQMDVIETLTVKDGKITQLLHRSTPEEDAKWAAYSGDLTKWAESQDLEEARAWLSEDAKGVYGYDWGVALEALCKKYEAAKVQAQDSVDVVKAWLDALNSGDLDAALALMTPNALIPDWGSARNTLKWWIDIRTHYGLPDCQQQGKKLVCDFIMTDDGCIKASGDADGIPVREGFTFQDGKIERVDVMVVDWEDYGPWLEAEMPWAATNRADEWAKIDFDTLKEGGEIAIKLCQEYAALAEQQVSLITAPAQALMDAINSGEVDAALAVLPKDARFQVSTDIAAGVDQLRPMFEWLAGKETQYQITDCVWQGSALECAMTATDGCVAASGAPDGISGKMRFHALEDGTLRNVVGVFLLPERKAYETWQEAESAWASANRADEFAQAEGYSQPAGAMAVKLCQEYAAAGQLDDATVAKIEGILGDQMQPNSVPGYAMCVVKDGSEVYRKGFGVAELGGDRPVTPQSVFAIRSTTKSFTAVALMQLVEQGKVDLDKSVTTYLPYFEMADPRYKDITVHMLASHTSGLTDEAVTATLPESAEPAAVDEALEWYVRSLSDDALTAAPGEAWQYAGVNFGILGDLISEVSGVPYDRYVVQNVLEPLKMTHSTFDAAAIPSDALVGEHVTGDDAVVKATPLTDFSGRSMPEAGIYSTCEDMARWMQVHLNRGELDGARILKPESYDILWKVVAPTGLDEFFGAWAGQYGLGWSIGENGGHFLASHPGGGEGQNIHFQLAPDDNLGVVVLANWGTETIAFPAWTAAADVTYALLDIDK